jgi:hypothetical protein
MALQGIKEAISSAEVLVFISGTGSWGTGFGH